MSDYDPKAIDKMAALLNVIATVTMVLFGLAAILTLFIAGSLGGYGGGLYQGLGWLGGLVYGGLIFGIGYLIALVVRVIAQLMLAVVQIEYDTARTNRILRKMYQGLAESRDSTSRPFGSVPSELAAAYRGYQEVNRAG